MEGGTEPLRCAATRWSLKGDKDLLDILQNLHQRIISKCQETNQKLDEMVTALDEASVHLQNVNIKFTALSNSQFVESRVYDDDADIINENTITKEPEKPKQSENDDIDKLRHSMQVLEAYHETVTILCESDSESGSDDDEDVARIVLKPKDMYSERPLPHIIGSQAWKSKWHAGLLLDESESDSDSNRQREGSVYSDSEPESPRAPQGLARGVRDRTISSSSSDLHSEVESVPPSKPQMTQSDIAAELARRLGGGGGAKMSEQDEEEPTPAVRKVYKPEPPKAATIFSDEPPPLEADSSTSDDDIFAEINRNVPYNQSREHSVHDDLFGKPVFEDTKKPIGGKSLFGSNAESIGAAILKRNQRQSSTSGEDSDREPDILNKPTKVQTINKPEGGTKVDTINTGIVHQVNKPELAKKVINDKKETQKQKERDIFDDLFAKSEKINKESEKSKTIAKKDDKKVDIFSDNIFDDMDDIFTSSISNIKGNEESKNKGKSIFDDDDDDLFSDIAVSKDDKGKKDDDLFKEKDLKVNTASMKPNTKKVDDIIKETQSLFDDDSDSDIFSDKSSKVTNKSDQKVKEDDIFADDNMFSKTTEKDNVVKKESPNTDLDKNKSKPVEITSKTIKSPNLFDDDDEDIFATKTKLESNDKDLKGAQNNEKLFSKDVDTVANKEQKIEENFVPTKLKETYIDSESTKPQLEVKAPKPTEIKIDTVLKGDFLNKELLFESTFASKTEDKPKTTEDDDFDNDFDSESESDILQTPKKVSEEKPSVTTVKPNIAKKPESVTEIVSKIEPEIAVKLSVSKKPVKREPVTDHFDDKEKAQKENISETNSKTASNSNITPKDTNIEKMDTAQDDLKTAEKNTKKEEQPDIFTDIFNDQPPEFEKPKEPKRSKNINALFDDDSDDEALFLKKNDVVDEKLDDFSPDVKEDRLFGLFRDEPPAIDVDFVQKPLKKDINKDKFTEKPFEDDIPGLIQDFSKVTPKTDVFDDGLGKTDNLFSDITDDIFQKPASIFGENVAENNGKKDEMDSIFKTDDDLFKTQQDKTKTLPKDQKTDLESSKAEVQEPKKVGKLKPMNLNINVNTLLPGALPKKPKTNEQTDGQITSTRSNEELKTAEIEATEKNIDPKMVKSVSFDSDPDSAILDNKLSKERAKIQVKRRPSTRRARKEAVKKSGIDFGEDSTDNSSSFDDLPRKNHNKPSEEVKQASKVEKQQKDQDKLDNEMSTPQIEPKAAVHKDESENVVSETKTSLGADDIFADMIQDIQSDETVTKLLESDKSANIPSLEHDVFNVNETKPETKSIESITETKVEQNIESKASNVTSKVVYVLNDEDIFSSHSNSSTKTDIFGTNKEINTVRKQLEIQSSSDDESIFKDTSKQNKNLEGTKEILTEKNKTTSNTEKFNENTKTKEIFDVKKQNKTLFDDIDDDELFSNKKPTKSIFASDSEEDLFAGKKESKEVAKKVEEVTKKLVEVKKEVVKEKVSLFKDDSDDDELFGVKTKKSTEPKPKFPNSTKDGAKSSETVFQDPLSIFGSDED